MIEPSQIYSKAMGTESITASCENAVFNKLINCGDGLNNQSSALYVAEIYCYSKMVIAQTARFESLNAKVDVLIASLDAANAELLKKQNK